MKMTPAGTANILNYRPYMRPCPRRFHVPIPSLGDVQLFVKFGSTKPAGFEFTMIDLCANQNAAATTDCYVIGWNGSYWFGVFKNFKSTAVYSSFVLSMTTGSQTFFSEVYQLPSECDVLTKLSVCYPSKYNAEDANGIYIGLVDTTQPFAGRPSIFYHHAFWTRQGEVIEVSNKITFTANSKKNFATTLVKNFELRPELLPGWYKDYLLSVYFRGNVLINGTPALVTDLNFEDVDEDYWKAYAVLSKEIKGGFGCTPFECTEDDCAPIVCVPVTFAEPTLPNAIVGYPYRQEINLAGSAPFSIYGEDLPAWLHADVEGSLAVLTGTPGEGDAGAVAIAFSIMNVCGDKPFNSNITVAVEPPITNVSGSISFAARNVTVSISQAIPCPVTFEILGNYDLDGTQTEFAVNVTIPAGATIVTKNASEVGHYVITCIRPTTAGETTYENSFVCGEVNYQFTLEISTPC